MKNGHGFTLEQHRWSAALLFHVRDTLSQIALIIVNSYPRKCDLNRKAYPLIAQGTLYPVKVILADKVEQEHGERYFNIYQFGDNTIPPRPEDYIKPNTPQDLEQRLLTNRRRSKRKPRLTSNELILLSSCLYQINNAVTRLLPEIYDSYPTSDYLKLSDRISVCVTSVKDLIKAISLELKHMSVIETDLVSGRKKRR